MALFLIISGVLMLVSSVKDTQEILFSQIAEDIPDYWHLALAIIVVGAIGFVPKLKPVSIGMLSLLLISIFEINGTNFFSNISQSIQGGNSNGKTSN